MPNIKWAGIIKGSFSEYQSGDLSENAVRIETPATMNEVMTKSMVYMIPAWIIVSLAVFVKTYFSKEFPISPIFIAVGVIIGITVGILLHELLHAIVYPKNATVHIGIYLKSISAVALSSYPIPKCRFILMSLLPFVVGIVPLVLFLILPSEMKAANGILFGFSCIGLCSPAPDLFNVYTILRHTPSKCMIQFHGNDLYYIQ